LRTIDFIWQQHAQTENAHKIAGAAQEFYARMVKFTEHFEKLRAGLERANSAFNDATASFQTRVRPAGERLLALGGGVAGKELSDVQPLDSSSQSPPTVTDSTRAADTSVADEIGVTPTTESSTGKPPELVE
jgi:DNA recombination protein RmuC